MPSSTLTHPRWRPLAETDPDIARAVRDELQRQNSGLELIASENFVSQAVLQAAGSVMTNKYAEGYPGKRYYGGGGVVLVAENPATPPAEQVFWARHTNQHPHPRAPAPTTAFFPPPQPRGTPP